MDMLLGLLALLLIVLIFIGLISLVYVLYKAFTASPEEKKRNREKAEKSFAEYSKKSDQKRGWIAQDFEQVSEEGYCPKCGSHEWKSAALVHMDGISTISTSTVGLGVGMDEDAHISGMGAGVGRTNGTHQTMLSELAAPPEKPISLKWAPPTFIVLAIAGLIFEWVFVFVIFGTLSILIGVANFLRPELAEEDNKKYQQALSDYSNKRVCQRCGTFFYLKQEIYTTQPN
jgi:hypothetical protein